MPAEGEQNAEPAPSKNAWSSKEEEAVVVTNQPQGGQPVEMGAVPNQYGAGQQYGYQNQAMTDQPGSYQAQAQGQGGYYAPPPGGQPMPPAPPGAPAWMMRPPTLQGCPPGLEYLTMIDQIIVQQDIFAVEIVTGWERKNKFRILNSLSQQIYHAQEESSCLMRQCCGAGRGFELNITDNTNQEVMKLVRKFKCCSGCCWCANCEHCAYNIVVEAPVGTEIGYIKQTCSAWKPNYSMFNSNDDVIGHIHGPCCPCHCICNACSDLNFRVMSADEGTEIGMINKQWAGAGRELFTDASMFGVTFPMDMDVKMKAVIVGATFLIDIMYFENSK